MSPDNPIDPMLASPNQLSAGSFHICVLDDKGLVYCGSNDKGQTTVPKLSNHSQISVGYEITCAIDDSVVIC